MGIQVALGVNAQCAGDVAIKRHDEIGLGNQRLGAFDPFRLDGVGRRAQACRIRESHKPIADLQALFDGITRGAGRVRDDRAIRAQERVHQRTLAGVRRTGEHHQRPFAQKPSLARCGNQAFRPLPQRRQPGRRLFGEARRQFAFVEIERMLQTAGQVDRVGIQPLERTRERAAQPRERIRRRARRPRIHEIDHGLGLAQVQPPVEKRAQGELAALRQTRPGGQADLQHATRRHAAAVALQFHRILAGVGTRAAKHEHQAVIHVRKPRTEETARIVGGKGTPRHLRRDGPGVRTGHAHDGHAAATGRGGDGGDRVGARFHQSM